MRLRITTTAPLTVVPVRVGDPWERAESANLGLLARIEAGAEQVPEGYASRADYATHVSRCIGLRPWPQPCRSFGAVGAS